MILKKKEETFLDTVKMRYKTDLVMNQFATLMILLMPLILYLILQIVPNFGGQYDILNDNRDTIITVLVMIQYLIVALVIFKLYNRLYAHSKRDRRWRAALTKYLEDIRKTEVGWLREIDIGIRKKERFYTRYFVIAAMALLFVSTVFFFLIYIPDMEANDYVPSTEIVSFVYDYLMKYTIDFGLEDDSLTMLFSIQQTELCILLLMVLLSIHKILWFPWIHDKLQCNYTRAFADTAARMGIRVPIMEETEDRKYRLHGSIALAMIGRVFLVIVTFGIYLIPWIYHSFREANNHFAKQWRYEAKMLNIIEGTNAFSREDLVDYEWSSNWIRRLKEFFVQKGSRDNGMPPLLLLAEMFILVLCANYCLKILAIEFDMVLGYESYAIVKDSLNDIEFTSWVTMVMVIFDLIALLGTIDALLGIASKRPASWRKATKSCITFIIPIWVGELITDATGLAHLFDFNPYITTGVLYNMLLILVLSVSIKKFYAPINEEMPGTLTWIRYIFFGSLEKKKVVKKNEIQ